MKGANANLVKAILDVAERGPERQALSDGESSLSFEELASCVANVASHLVDQGVGRGDRVALYAPDCVDSAVALLAILHEGAVAVPLSELLAAGDVRQRLVAGECRYIICGDSLVDSLDGIVEDVDSLDGLLKLPKSSIEAKSSPDDAREGPAEMAESDPAILLFSAGHSTVQVGPTKHGVLHTHGTPHKAYSSFASDFLDLGAEDAVFSTMRFSTAYGLGIGLLFPLMAGAESMLLPTQAHSKALFKRIAEGTPTVFAATPSVYGQMSRDAAAAGQGKVLASLRWCLAGAEDMPPKVIAMVRAVLGNNVAVGYGLTEAFQFVMAGRAAGKRPGNCGVPLEGYACRVVDEEGNAVGVDEIGTLQVQGSGLVTTYLDETPVVGPDGWFTTRDRFLVDGEGTYYHCGRADQLFKVGGKWVDPKEVEHSLLAHEAVWECAVIGADDEDGLIKPFAFVVPNLGQTPGADLEKELREYVKGALAPYKYPRWIEFVDELPKGAGGVILRYTLRDRLQESRNRRLAEPPPDKTSA